jgi:choline-sulfatase
MSCQLRPNILVIMSDQHTQSVMGCAGNPVVRTPYLDRLAGEGIRLKSTYCAAPLCGPSRMSFMTSRRPSGNRCWSNGQVLSSAIPTWSHSLGASGYKTALIGRMDFRGCDQRHGFEQRLMGDYNTRYPGAPFVGGPLRSRIPKGAGDVDGETIVSGHGTTHRHHYDDHVMERTCSFLRNHAEQNDGRPFAAVAGFWLPHPPLIAPRNLFEYYQKKVSFTSHPGEEETSAQPASIRHFRKCSKMLNPIKDQAIQNATAAYYSLVEYMDQHIGRILRSLDESGLAENTLVIYTSDHGEMLGSHGCWGKSNYYEESVTVPFIARLPGVIKSGHTSSAVTNLTDLGSTLIELAGAQPLKYADGRSILPILRNENAEEWKQETFSEVVDKKTGLASVMVRSEQWKMWKYHADFPPALFDLASDPKEMNDLGLSPKHEGIRNQLTKRIEEWWDPQLIVRENAEQNDNVNTLKKWGAAVKPSHPDSFAAPPPEIEEDVVIL